MEAHHASLGRQKLEDIRQKRAAERMQKASSGSDPDSNNPYGSFSSGMHTSHSGSRISEVDPNGTSRARDLEKKNAELKEENQKLLSKLDAMKVENDSFMQQIHDLEVNILPSLRKALKDTSIEKDAAIVSREDALAQLRTMKKRLKEAEEDQYRAEEDAATLRAELNSLQQQVLGNSFANMSSMDISSERIQAMEKEIVELRTLLQKESLLRQEEQQKLVQEQLRTSSLMAERQELEERLEALSKKASEEAAEANAQKTFSAKDKEKYEIQMHDLAVMVERLENSRQKLLMEIDSQSSEIERLFEENSNLSTACKEAMGTSVQWESQVKDCLKQNEELRHQLDILRSEQVMLLQSSNCDTKSNMESMSIGNVSDASHPVPEVALLKEQLAKEQSRAEALAAEVMKLSADQKRAIQAYKNISRFYSPVLRDIKNSLTMMKQDSFAL